MSSPGSLLKKISIISSRPRPFRVAILGQNGVGKTALVVRFITRRYIGEYDPLLERVYTCQKTIHGSPVEFEVWDTAGMNENNKLKEKIRWADAIVLMYDVTDRISFNECSRLKFLVNAHSRRSRHKTGSDPNSELTNSIPVTLVGNKKDKVQDRMVPFEEGATRSGQLNCISFTEVSVREDVDDVIDIFEELYTTNRKMRKFQMSLAFSKSSLIFERPTSSSEDDNEEGDGAGGGGGGCGGKGGMLRSSSESTSQDGLTRRPRSRRREAFYTIC